MGGIWLSDAVETTNCGRLAPVASRQLGCDAPGSRLLPVHPESAYPTGRSARKRGVRFQNKGEGDERKGPRISVETRPSPSFDRVARQQSPTGFSAYPRSFGRQGTLSARVAPMPAKRAQQELPFVLKTHSHDTQVRKSRMNLPWWLIRPLPQRFHDTY